MNKKVIYALGFFDGVHLGHQALLKACRELAKKHGCFSGAVTFTNHPDGLVAGKPPVLINTTEDRKRLLLRYQTDTIVYLPFDKALMSKSWQDFLEELLAKDAAGFVCGSDFRFGAGGSGTAEKLLTFCECQKLPCAIVPQQELDGIRVSSTHIRTLLEQGDIAQANRFLGHPHMLTGTVQNGKQLGRTIGVPTANLAYPSELVQLKKGVYACKAYACGKEYPAVTNIGTRPTVDGQGVNLEAHLLDFAGDLYGKTLTLAFYRFLRPEQAFGSLEELKSQITADIAKTRTLLGSPFGRAGKNL